MVQAIFETEAEQTNITWRVYVCVIVYSNTSVYWGEGTIWFVLFTECIPDVDFDKKASRSHEIKCSVFCGVVDDFAF